MLCGGMIFFNEFQVKLCYIPNLLILYIHIKADASLVNIGLKIMFISLSDIPTYVYTFLELFKKNHLDIHLVVLNFLYHSRIFFLLQITCIERLQNIFKQTNCVYLSVCHSFCSSLILFVCLSVCLLFLITSYIYPKTMMLLS